MLNKRNFLMFVACFLVCGVTAHAQMDDFRTKKQEAKEKRATDSIQRSSTILEERIKARRALEKSLFELDVVDSWVDPEEYLIGPGDILAINLSGGFPLYLEVLVSAEGLVDVPGHFSVNVKGKTLSESKALLQNKMQDYYKDAEISVNLVGIRPMKVYVLGEVYSPGSCLSKPTDRLFDVLARIGGAKRLANLNAIQIFRDTDTLLINGLQYQLEGNLAANPRLFDGDVIFVSPAVLNEETVTVQGGVLEPGLYPIYPGQSLYNFLSRYINFSEDAELGLISITRSGTGGLDVHTFDMNTPQVSNEIREFLLRAGDLLEISIFSEVYVQGEVNLPGSFPFVRSYNAIDYIGMAGGHTDKGSRHKVIITHQDGTESQGYSTIIKRGDRIFVPFSEEQVYVQGAVNSPGAFPFVADFKAIDYVGLAGGNKETGRAKSVRVIHRDGTKGSGLYADVERGDIIIVPRSLGKILFGDYGFVQVIGTIASVILTIDVLNRPN
jgi:protein involved in polysaccharide export with SLBB domain